MTAPFILLIKSRFSSLFFFNVDFNAFNKPLDSEIKPVNDLNFCSLLEIVFSFFYFGHSILMGGLFDFK